MNDQRFIIVSRLQAIVTASRQLVKRLKRMRASLVITARFVNLSIQAESLQKRTDYLLPTFRRYAEKIEFDFEHAVQEVSAAYPNLGSELPPSDQLAAPIVESTKTVRVSITLRSEDWTMIDYYVRSGHVDSYAAYFRRLHSKQHKE